MPSNDPIHDHPAGPVSEELGDAGTLVVEDPGFAIVGEWVITAEISDAAFRVYSMLLRFGNTSGNRMPSRALLARRLHRSVDSIDRALRELQSTGLVRVEHRHDGRQYRSNRYHVLTTPPSTAGARDVAVAAEEGGRTSAATRVQRRGGRRSAATPGRRTAARVAADPRPYPDPVTQTPPPPAGGPDDATAALPLKDLLARCGIDDLDALAARCAAARHALGKPTTRWAPACLLTALQLAVVVRGWPAHLAAGALLAVASDPVTRSPARLAEAGPWWDGPSPDPDTSSSGDGGDLAALEERLAELGGQRPALQARARAELAAEQLPVTRATVTRRAIAILDRQDQPA